ncbi:MAG: ATP-grasp domain-containing protein [Ruminococcus sp.]
MKDIIFLFCSNPLEPRHPDFDYAGEYKQVQHSAFPQVLFDFDSFVSGNTAVLPDTEQDKCMIYRGWMMKPETYCQFYHALAEKQCFLINTPEQYCFCHTLPGWYDTLSDITPKSRWTEDLSDHAIRKQLQAFGNAPVIIKDYVKSRKHEWKEACFIPNAADTKQAMQVIHTFMERQGENLVGGLVIREYLNLNKVGVHPKSGMPVSEEYRAFFLNGTCICIIDYWNGTETISEEINAFVNKIAPKVKSNFFTVDVARTTDNKLVIMEIGDGQVSGLQNFSEDIFYQKLFTILEREQ